jgi:hypothetical protein
MSTYRDYKGSGNMGILKWITGLLGSQAEAATVTAITPEVAVKCSLPMDDEEKNLVAVIASCIVGKDTPDAQLHIQRITRID